MKGLYGLKQAGNIWYKMFVKHLVDEVRLIPHDLKPCIFTSVDTKGEIKSISSLYVDDSLIGGPDEEIERIKKEIGEKFPIKDLGEAKHVVGMQVEQLEDETLLTQMAYTKETVELIGQINSSPVLTPFSKDDLSYTVLKTEKEEDKQQKCISLNKEEHHIYREYIGKLMYLMVCTRLDIVFAVCFLA